MHTYFFTDIGTVKAVNGVSFEVPQARRGDRGRVGLRQVRDQLSLMQLVQRPSGQTVEGEIRFNSGEKVYNVVNTPASVMQQRGKLYVHDFPGAHDLPEPGIPDREQVDEIITLHNPENVEGAGEGPDAGNAGRDRIANKRACIGCIRMKLSGGMRSVS